MRKCNVCSSIDLPGVEMDSSNRGPMIMFATYMTQFTISLFVSMQDELYFIISRMYFPSLSQAAEFIAH